MLGGGPYVAFHSSNVQHDINIRACAAPPTTSPRRELYSCLIRTDRIGRVEESEWSMKSGESASSLDARYHCILVVDTARGFRSGSRRSC